MGTTVAFGALLRRYRQAAGLTQEALGERAGLSVRGISDLERGISRAPQRETATRLADALALPSAAREQLLAAARSGTAWLGEEVPPRPGRPRRQGHPPVPASASGLLVGRTVDLASLEWYLTGAGAPLLLLTGVPGIGKSRLLREAASLAAVAGWAVLAGGCTRGGGQEPFAPLPQALQRYLARVPAAQMRTALAGCAWLVRLLPELANGPVEPLPRWTPAPAQERRLIFEAVGRFLSNVAGPAGTLLVLDDLQWAGADALDLLATLVRAAAGRLRILGAFREGEVGPKHPLEALLADLAPAGLVQRRQVGPLARAEAEQLLGALAPGGQEGAAWREAVLARAGGVPFYLRSFALAATNDPQGGAGAVPWDAAQSIRGRVTALPEAARDVLGAAAVVGRVVERAILVSMSAWPRGTVLDALDAVCHARLLEEDGPAAYRFAHDLVREVVEGDLSAGRRAALHQRAAEALEAMPEMPTLTRLAYHYARSDALDKAILYLERAGDQAVARVAPAAAESHYRDLVQRLEALGRRYEAARVYAKLGMVLDWSRGNVEAIAALQQMADSYSVIKSATPQEEATTSVQPGGKPRVTQHGLTNVQTILSLIEEREPVFARGGFYLAYATLLTAQNRFQDSLILMERAGELARRLGDHTLLVQALRCRGTTCELLGRLEEALASLHQALRICEDGNDLGLLNAVLDALVGAHEAIGDFDQSARYNARCLEIAEAVGDTGTMASGVRWRGLLAKHTGDWAGARADLALALQLVPDFAHDAWFNCTRGELALVQGAWTEAAVYLEEALAMAVRIGHRTAQVCAESFLAELNLLQDRPVVALAHVRSALAQEESLFVVRLLPSLALAQLQLGDVNEAAAVARDAVRRATADGNRLALPDALRVQAMVATTRQQWEEAEQALEEGLALTGQMGYPYAEARLLHVYGLMHAQQGEPEPARERLEAALAIFRRLGASKDIERAEHLLATLGHRIGEQASTRRDFT